MIIKWQEWQGTEKECTRGVVGEEDEGDRDRPSQDLEYKAQDAGFLLKALRNHSRSQMAFP